MARFLNTFSCGVVVPVRDEADTLRYTVPALLQVVQAVRAQVVWVCNGCTDDSASIIRGLAGTLGTVLELQQPSKTGALQAGDEALGDLFPRFYLDADAWLRVDDLQRLLAALSIEEIEMVGARNAFDCTKATALSAAMARCWLSLPYARERCFTGLIGVSRKARSRWTSWPDVLGDDLYAAAMVPSERRLIVSDTLLTSQPPADFRGWVRTRQRWAEGERQLLGLGIKMPPRLTQRRALLLRLINPATAIGAAAFILARLLGSARARRKPISSWVPERYGS